MDETATVNRTPELNKALASLQANLPRVGKGKTAKVRSDKGNYSYDYADLADVSQAILPLLGKHGLSFTSKPTLIGGQFGLAYALRHASGEHDDGFYPLPSGGTPQAIGSAITYARRYCLCAVTGVAPDGDDDDAAAAQAASRSAGDAWDSAAPAAPKANGNGNGRPAGQVSRPAATPKPPAANGEPDPDAQPFADEAHEARTLGALRAIQTKAREEHKLAALIRNPASGGVGGLGAFIDYHRKRLTEIDAALKALSEGADPEMDLDAHVRKITGAGIEDATAVQLRQAAEALKAGAPA